MSYDGVLKSWRTAWKTWRKSIEEVNSIFDYFGSLVVLQILYFKELAYLETYSFFGSDKL